MRQDLGEKRVSVWVMFRLVPEKRIRTLNPLAALALIFGTTAVFLVLGPKIDNGDAGIFAFPTGALALWRARSTTTSP